MLILLISIIMILIKVGKIIFEFFCKLLINVLFVVKCFLLIILGRIVLNVGFV